MPFNDRQLSLKAEGTVSGLENMTAKQREQAVTDVIAEDYNRLREFVLEAHPELEKLLPPQLQRKADPYSLEPDSGRFLANYQDIHAFSAQIANFVRAGLPKTGRLL